MKRLSFHPPVSLKMDLLKKMHYFLLLCFVLCFMRTNSQVPMSYSVVQRLGSPCPQMESCEHHRTSAKGELFPTKEKNCACDDLCVEYGDCCIDAPGNSARNFSSEYNCYDLKQFGGVYMKDSCQPSFTGPDEVRHKCENTMLADLSDPVGSLPVTNFVTGVTYKNYYCSICNYDTDNTVLWTPRLQCPTLTLFDSSNNISQEYVLENLASVGVSWGIYLAGENGSLFFHDCDVDPVMPTLLANKIRLCKTELVSDCPPEWQDEEVRTLCKSYMGARFVQSEDRFKNVHCALCNGQNLTQLSCQSAEMRGMVFFRQFETRAFSLLLDINEGRGEEVGFVQMCKNGEVFDPFYKKCRSLSCLPGYVKHEGGCTPIREITEIAIDDGPILSAEYGDEGDKNALNTLVQYNPVSETLEKEIQLSENGSSSHNLSKVDSDTLTEEINELRNCLLISLTDEDYVMLPNNSIYVPKYGKIYKPTSYHTADGSILVCSHFVSQSDVKFLPPMGYMTVIGLSVSMLCLLLHFVAFWFVPDLQNLSGKCLVSQCVSLFFAYALFITGLFDTLGFIGCSAVAFLTSYFFLVSFVWMAVMAYDVWRTLKMATVELRVANGRQIKRFLCYSFFTWITPLFLLGIVALAEYTDLFPLIYRPGFASPYCWFKRRRALFVFFVVPLIVIMLSNAILFISSSRMILLTAKTVVKQQNQNQKRTFSLYLRLAVLMGLTWLFGLVAGYADVEVLWYFFIIFNTFQGLFIFIAFTCSTKVFGYLKNKTGRGIKPTEFKSTTQSTGSTNSTSLHSSLVKKFSSRLLRHKDSTATNSTSSIKSHQNHPPF